ncbi:MAG: acyl-CoA synthetase [Acidobacteria bacterium]|nr:MAG: acyl-CoA synthetase [Acidobacteriota bacterium]REK10333.1 MAG: acyl-CoA synthetase [Acidobacteriota bacterium]
MSSTITSSIPGDLASLAEHAHQRLGERRSLWFEGGWVTNTETLERARRLHRAFAELGLGKGRIGALCMINDPLIYPVFQGIFRTGGAAVPVMFQLSASELRFILEDTRAHLVVTDAANLEKVKEAVLGLDSVQTIVARGVEADPDHDPPILRLETLLESEPQLTLPRIDSGDLSLLLYTSGTTGKPKGAMLSHANLIASARASAAASEFDRIEKPRVSISAMPMAHIFGVGVMNGGYLVPERLADGYMVQLVWFDPKRFLELIQEHRCATMPAVPTMLALLLNHPESRNYDLTSLEDVVCGAAPLPVELARAFEKRAGCRVREIYGMTESTGMGSANRSSDPAKPGSAGRAYPDHEIGIQDDEGRFLPVGERGEVVIKGPSVMMGYLNRPEATAETVRDGWLHTGDVGYLDDDGFLFIVDRKKDMIIRGGENIYPAEIEEVLYRHPAVAEAAVVGVPDEVYGESVLAFVALKGGFEPGDELAGELRAFVKQHVTPFKAPGEIRFLEALPKSGMGKILRRELRDQGSGVRG